MDLKTQIMQITNAHYPGAYKETNVSEKPSPLTIESMQAQGIPEHLCHGLMRFLQFGIKPGSFLTAVLGDDLYRAVALADPEALSAIGPIAMWIRRNLPRDAYGTQDRVTAWRGDAG